MVHKQLEVSDSASRHLCFGLSTMANSATCVSLRGVVPAAAGKWRVLVRSWETYAP